MTQLTLRFAEAVDYARAAHAGQVRKGSARPYIAHPIAVASLVLDHGGDEDQAIAALLHDVVEDCGAHHESAIRERFGTRVAAIVMACSDATMESKKEVASPEEKRAAWWPRKRAHIAALAGEADEVLLVYACDKLHNARAVVEQLEGPDAATAFAHFTTGREGTLWYFGELAALFTRRGLPVAPALAREVEAMSR
jgi:(p)ppGpp synthase/HD superfamily hydrolase